MDYEMIGNNDYNIFHRLLEDYYRDGEDAGMFLMVHQQATDCQL